MAALHDTFRLVRSPLLVIDPHQVGAHGEAADLGQGEETTVAQELAHAARRDRAEGLIDAAGGVVSVCVVGEVDRRGR